MALSSNPQSAPAPPVLDLRPRPTLRTDEDAIKEIRRSRSANISKMAVAACDVTAFLLAVGIGYRFTRETVKGDPITWAQYSLVAVASVPMLLVSLTSRRLYQARFVARRSEELRRLIDSLLLTVMAMIMVSFFLKIQVSRTWILVSVMFALPTMWAEREGVRRFFRHRRQTGRSVRQVVVVGTNSEASAVVAMLKADRSLGYEVLGVVEGKPHGADFDATEFVNRTITLVNDTGATGVVVAATALDLKASNQLIRILAHAGLHVELTSALSDVETSRISIRPLGRYPILYIEPVYRFGWRPIAKRGFDLVVAALALLVLALPLAAVALAVKLTSPGPVLFRQARLGRDGREFEIFKFRSMVVDAEERLIDLRAANEADGPLFKLRHDPRVTKVGAILRKTSVDELPQLWNVVRGEMSLVGPRPALPVEAVSWSPVLFDRLRVRPGITGMWQVSGRSDTNFDEYTRLDLYYVDNWSLLVDLSILFRTLPAVLASRGAH